MRNRFGKYRWICSKCTKKAAGILNFGSLKTMNDEEIRSLLENNGESKHVQRMVILQIWLLYQSISQSVTYA